jgi:hypothetical protein
VAQGRHGFIARPHLTAGVQTLPSALLTSQFNIYDGKDVWIRPAQVSYATLLALGLVWLQQTKATERLPMDLYILSIHSKGTTVRLEHGTLATQRIVLGRTYGPLTHVLK